MVTQQATIPHGVSGTPVRRCTVWGLTPVELHDRFWAARGVQVVRCGEWSDIVEGAELFLLMAPRLLANFRMRRLVDQMSWLDPEVMWVRVRDERDRGYREQAVTDTDGGFVRFERNYGGSDSRLARVALTPSTRIARIWQTASDPRDGWARIREQVPPERRAAASIRGGAYDRDSDHEVMHYMRALIHHWSRPDATVERARKVGPGVWVDIDADVSKATKFIGEVWVGAGRELTDEASVVGPAALWDLPEARPATTQVDWENIEPTQGVDRNTRVLRQQSASGKVAKRLFDVVVALSVLLVTLPLFPMIMLAIWLEDGRPFFFAHRRETREGKTFPCLKFRSMRRDAEKIRQSLAEVNEADGPQFYIPEDPRLTKVGKFLRRFHLDELPQLLNVLAGDMSIVGPRPSPHDENQCCPPWREARLSVRPGMTGLWQVKRTRQKGLDFQEWIKFDIEYVENASFKLDLWIIWRTAVNHLMGKQ